MHGHGRRQIEDGERPFPAVLPAGLDEDGLDRAHGRGRRREGERESLLGPWRQLDLGGLRPDRDPGRGPDYDLSFEGRRTEVGQTDPEVIAFDSRFEPDPVPEEVLQEDAVEK